MVDGATPIQNVSTKTRIDRDLCVKALNQMNLDIMWKVHKECLVMKSLLVWGVAQTGIKIRGISLWNNMVTRKIDSVDSNKGIKRGKIRVHLIWIEISWKLENRKPFWKEVWVFSKNTDGKVNGKIKILYMEECWVVRILKGGYFASHLMKVGNSLVMICTVQYCNFKILHA